LKRNLILSYPSFIRRSPLLNSPLASEVFNALYDDPERLIKMNKRLRKRGLHGKPWLNQLFAIGYRFRDTYSFIDISKEDEAVYLADRTKDGRYNPENLKKNVVHRDIDSYLSTPLIVLNDLEKQAKGEPEVEIDANACLVMIDQMIKMKKEERESENKNS